MRFLYVTPQFGHVLRFWLSSEYDCGLPHIGHSYRMHVHVQC